MKPKFQPTPSRISAIQKCATLRPDQPDDRGQRRQQQAERGDLLLAEARDQPAGEEARPEHRQHMPLDAERGIADRMAAADHGERGRRHDEAHQPIGDERGGDRGDEFRLAHDLGQAAGRRPDFTAATGGARSIITTAMVSRAKSALRQEARGEGRGGRQVAGPVDRLRADDAGRQAADHDPGDGARAEGLARGVGRGEAIALHEGAIEPAHEGADAEQPEHPRRPRRRPRCWRR